MSEADKKIRNADEAGAAARGANVKPFPDFIVAPPGGPGMTGDDAPASPPQPPPLPPSPPVGPLAAPPPIPAAPTAPVGRAPRARGGGWAFLFALVSLTAAGISLSGPSLRPIAAEKLKQQFGDQYWIGVLTGTADTRPASVIQLDLKQFDTRLEALAATLTTANPGAPIDAAALNRFADAAGATQRMSEFEAALNALKAGESEKITALGQAVARIDAALAEMNQRAEAIENVGRGLTEQLQATEARSAKALEIAELADTGTKELATSMGGLVQNLEAAQAGLTELTAKLDGVSAAIAGQIAAALAPLNNRLDGVDKHIADMAAQAATGLEGLRQDMAALGGNLAGLAEEMKATETLSATQDGRLSALSSETQALTSGLAKIEAVVAQQQGATGPALLSLTNRLRVAVDEGEPFVGELLAIRNLAAGEPAFAAPLAALAPLAERGAPGVSALRREFNVVARKVIEAEEAAQPTWYARQWSNVQYYLGLGGGASPVATPAPANGEGARAVLAQAANAINNGLFGEAVGAMSTLAGPGAEHTANWLAAARARVMADQATRSLGAAALARLVRQ